MLHQALLANHLCMPAAAWLSFSIPACCMITCKVCLLVRDTNLGLQHRGWISNLFFRRPWQVQSADEFPSMGLHVYLRLVLCITAFCCGPADDPIHLPHLIGPMKHYLWILKTTHGGADMDTCLEMAKGALDGNQLPFAFVHLRLKGLFQQIYILNHITGFKANPTCLLLHNMLAL